VLEIDIGIAIQAHAMSAIASCGAVGTSPSGSKEQVPRWAAGAAAPAVFHPTLFLSEGGERTAIVSITGNAIVAEGQEIGTGPGFGSDVEREVAVGKPGDPARKTVDTGAVVADDGFVDVDLPGGGRTFDQDAAAAVAGSDRALDHRPHRAAHSDPIRISLNPYIGQRRVDADRAGGRIDLDACDVVLHRRVVDKKFAAGCSLVIDTFLAEVPDHRIFNVNGGSRDNPDAFEAGARANRALGPRAIDIEIPDAHGPERVVCVACGDVDVDAVGAARQNAGENLMTIDRHRLDDRDGAEAAGIQAVYLAVDERLADRSGEGFARSGPAAGIGVIAHTGNPRARCLRMARNLTDRQQRSSGGRNLQ
jgi:hypothetical protein